MTVAVVLLAAASVAMILGPVHLVGYASLMPYLLILAALMLGQVRLFSSGVRRWWVKLLKFLALALNSLLLLGLGLAIPIMLIAKLTARDGINIACGPGRECHAYSRGAFGTYWQDLVLRQHYFGVYYLETPLRQFNREALNQLSYEPQSCRLLAEVQVYGEPAQTVAIKLPEPCLASEGARAIKPPAKTDPPHP